MKHIQNHLTEAMRLAAMNLREGSANDLFRLRLLRASLSKVTRGITGAALWRKQCGRVSREFMTDKYTHVWYVVETQGRLSFFDPASKRHDFDRMCGAVIGVYQPLPVRVDGKMHRAQGQLLSIGASFCPVKRQHRFSKREALFRAIKNVRPLNMGWMDSPTPLPQSLAALLFTVVGNDAPSTLLRDVTPATEVAVTHATTS